MASYKTGKGGGTMAKEEVKDYLKKLIFLVIFLCIVPVVAQGLEYNKYSEPTFSIENKTLIKSVNFCFEHDDKMLCKQVGDFRDDAIGISCNYLMFVRSIDVIHYQLRCELNKSEKICPVVLNLDKWPQKIVTDEFEISLDKKPVVLDTFPFMLSGNNRSLYFPKNEKYSYHLQKTDSGCLLRICSKESKNLYESSIEMVAISSELNKTNFHNHPSISLYENPPTGTLGPVESIAKIDIEEFFTGRILEWHPELPYANLAVEIAPKNKSYDKNEILILKFKSISGTYTERIPYNIENGKWSFPKSGTKQVAFDYNSWFFPLSKYTTEILIENDVPLAGNQTLEIHNSEFLDGTVSFDKNKIKIEIFHNWSCYLLLLIILSFFYPTLGYSLRQVKQKAKIPNFIYFLQLIPFSSIIVKDIMPLKSGFFFILLLSYVCFWLYFSYTKYKKH